MTLIEIQNLQFKYKEDQRFRLNIDRFSLKENTKLYLEGPSGCGKTTFLNLLTGLTKPSQGQIHILGTDIARLSTVQCDRFRADHFGSIFQLFNLIPYLTVIENVILPCTFSKRKREKALDLSPTLEAEANRLCAELDIDSDLIQKPVKHLSVGQQQRVAIARAIIGQPDIIVADEPTSALDYSRKVQFMNLLLSECDRYKASLIFVSHDPTLKGQFDHTYSLENA